MSTTTKKELIDRIAESTQAKRALVKDTVQSFLDEIICELAKGNRLEFRDFGILEPHQRAPRTAQNPKTLGRVHVPARQVVKFRAGRLMKQKLNGQNVDI
jgi:integration host factor subunit beta